MSKYKRIAQLKSAEKFAAYLQELGVDLPFDAEIDPAGALAQTKTVDGFTIGNRFAVLPMEGWDGTTDGKPTELTTRRWQRFGLGGAKLIWGGEAVAVQPEGRANPNQLMINDDTLGDIVALREALFSSHAEHHGTTDDLLVGLQLTHSGRFARPYDKKKLESRVAYRHPLLDKKFGVTDDAAILTDDEIKQLIDDFIAAAQRAQKAGFAFVDIKHCHGYLGHEFLSAIDREGAFGGSFENRTRFLRDIVAGIRSEAPGLKIGVRVSIWDWLPFKPGEDGTGTPESYENGAYRYAFGGDGTGTGMNYDEPVKFLDLLNDLDIKMTCISVGSPYYNPHIQRPALFPPSDGYQPPEDPLVGVARQIRTVAHLKSQRPDLVYVGSGYSYLQEWLPNVAQHVVANGMADFAGLGRMALSSPDLPADVLSGNKLQRKNFCRTFSDCTTGPRNGLVSGCYPLDEFYKEREEYDILMRIKKES